MLNADASVVVEIDRPLNYTCRCIDRIHDNTDSSTDKRLTALAN
jgi:hypothetical protein